MLLTLFIHSVHTLLSLRVSFKDLQGGGWRGRAGSRKGSEEQGVNDDQPSLGHKDPLAKARLVAVGGTGC